MDKQNWLPLYISISTFSASHLLYFFHTSYYTKLQLLKLLNADNSYILLVYYATSRFVYPFSPSDLAMFNYLILHHILMVWFEVPTLMLIIRAIQSCVRTY